MEKLPLMSKMLKGPLQTWDPVKSEKRFYLEM